MNEKQAMKIRSCFANGVGYLNSHTEETDVLAQELNDAIKKQIPVKPLKDREQEIRYTSAYSCPACGGNFTGTGIANHCYHCGQKLDWDWDEMWS
jgi:hypothetical protein